MSLAAGRGLAYSFRNEVNRPASHTDLYTSTAIYEGVLAVDPGDWMAIAMLAHCYEQLGRVPEALRLADEAVRIHPDVLITLQMLIRLAVAADQHDKAAEYVQPAVALPEVRNGIPDASATPPAALWLIRLLSHMPVLRRRIRPEDVRELEPGSRAVALDAWRRWAEEYLAWRKGAEPSGSGGAVH
jgi:tetratricopeptide (TPR) repeat protein